jgi:hypothetical protein
MVAKAHNSVHVKSGEDLVDLHSFLKKNKKGVFIVVVMMEGCPHCVTLEKDVVVPLLNDPNRTAGIASIQHTELDNTPLKSLRNKIRGYPTVIKVENGQSEEIENPRDLEAMKETVGVNSNEGASDGMDSPVLDESSENARKNNKMSAKNIRSLVKSPELRGPVNVPKANDDVLNSQNKDVSMNVNDFETPRSGKGAAVGGALYASLLAASKDLAPAVLLSTAAIASRIALSRRKSKRSKKTRRKLRFGKRRV